jgi:O-antigen ligase
MTGWRQLRELIVPAYLFLCIVFGGSAQAIWGNLILQLCALALIAWAVMQPLREARFAPHRAPLILLLAALLLIFAQLIPLPPDIWVRLPGRQIVARGFVLLGEPKPWLPLSLTPAETLSVGLSLLPPIAVVAAMTRLDACRTTWALASIVLATLLSIVLGYVQVSSGSSAWYLYDITNVGSAVGFFANRNHMGTLLVVAIPCIAALSSISATDDIRRSLPVRVAGLSSVLLVLLGIAMNGSLAAVLLALPVAIASSLLFASTRRFRTTGLVVAACAVAAAVAVIANSPVEAKLTGKETSSITSRQDIWATSMKAAVAAFPVGTGFGSFEQVYRLYEDPSAVSGKYVNHAHNDIIELLVEGGAPAILLLGACLLWWGRRAFQVWRQTDRQVAKAATIASAAILVHSLVDYPLRTPAVAAIFGLSIAVMAEARGWRNELHPSMLIEGRRARHVTIL